MDLGINLGYWGMGNDSDNLELAREADRLGYRVVWAAEAYGSDAATVLSWIAAQTEQIDIGSAVFQIPGRTPANTAMTVVFAFNYGSRWEITNATRRLVQEAAAGHIGPDDLDERVFARYLSVSDMPDLDLVIRTSGEHRLSNFLLWQAAYAELAFPGVLWPDFDRHALLDAVVDYQKRDRRFGGAVDHPTLP